MAKIPPEGLGFKFLKVPGQHFVVEFLPVLLYTQSNHI